TMLQLPVTVNDPRLKSASEPTHDVSGIIGMSGDVVGSVILSFPSETASSLVALFCGEQHAPDSPDFADAIGELVNMVSGGATSTGRTECASTACPSVVSGKVRSVARQTDIPCVCIPCVTDCGELTIEVAIRVTETARKPAQAASVA